MGSLPRLFVDPAQLAAGPMRLGRDDQHRLQHVLRLAVGASIELFDGNGRRAAAQLIGDGSSLQVETPQICQETQISLCVAVGMPSPERGDWMVEKLVELGVRTIQPLICARSQGGAAGRMLAKRLPRWERLAIAAARQAQRFVLPQIRSPLALEALPAPGPGTQGYVADLGAAAPPRAAPSAAPKQLVIGPPGGLTDAELGVLYQHGYTALNLGPYVLRTETAALCASSLLLQGVR
jgi:16S rRNA (uracil1498-N3)-methyltransferase